MQNTFIIKSTVGQQINVYSDKMMISKKVFSDIR